MPFPVIPVAIALGLYVLHAALEEKPKSQADSPEKVKENISDESDPETIACPANTVPESVPESTANSVPEVEPPNPSE